MLSKEQVNDFKNRLEKARDDIEKELNSLGADKPPDFGSDVDHFEEEADEAEEFTTNVGVANALKQRLADIEAALAKIKTGKYGICEKCGKDIEPAVLDAAPESHFCREHKITQERKN